MEAIIDNPWKLYSAYATPSLAFVLGMMMADGTMMTWYPYICVFTFQIFIWILVDKRDFMRAEG